MVKSRAPASVVIGLSDKHWPYFALFDSTSPQNSGPSAYFVSTSLDPKCKSVYV